MEEGEVEEEEVEVVAAAGVVDGAADQAAVTLAARAAILSSSGVMEQEQGRPEHQLTATGLQDMEQTLVPVFLEVWEGMVEVGSAKNLLVWELEQDLLEGQLLVRLELWQPMACITDTTSTG